MTPKVIVQCAEDVIAAWIDQLQWLLHVACSGCDYAFAWIPINALDVAAHVCQ